MFIKSESFLCLQVADNVAWISGVRLLPGDSGTIGWGEDADVMLPDSLPPPRGWDAPVKAMIKVDITPSSALGLTNLQPSVAKSGTYSGDFQILVTNTNPNLGTQDLEIYVTVLGGC